MSVIMSRMVATTFKYKRLSVCARHLTNEEKNPILLASLNKPSCKSKLTPKKNKNLFWGGGGNMERRGKKLQLT